MSLIDIVSEICEKLRAIVRNICGGEQRSEEVTRMLMIDMLVGFRSIELHNKNLNFTYELTLRVFYSYVNSYE